MTVHIIEGPDRDMLREVYENARRIDRIEIAATNRCASDAQYVTQLYIVSQMKGAVSYGAFLGDKPAAVWGYVPLWKGVCVVWAFGTDDWPKVVKDVTRHIQEVMMSRIRSEGYHRAECRALASREDSEKWLTHLGATKEAVCAGFGSQREDFALYAWVDDDGRG